MFRRRAPALLAEAIPFQQSLEEIVDAPVPRQLRLTGAIAAALLAALLLCASLSSVDIIVQAEGHLAADAPTVMLQPMERSIVRRLAVKPGDLVTKGQILATLDPTFSEAEQRSQIAQQRALRAAMLRINAELAGKLFTGNTGDPDIALQITLFQQHQAQYAAHLRTMDEEIGRDMSDVQVTQAEADLLTRQLANAKSIEGIRSALLATQNGSRLNFLDAQAATLRAERDYQGAEGRLTDLRHGIDAKLADREAYVSQWRAGLLEELARSRTELAKIDDALTKAERLHDLVRLTAPTDGVVLEVARRSEGSVVREAEPLITLLPSRASLIADVRIASADIGSLHPGVPVLIKVDAFPYQRHGALSGRLRAIGEEAVAAESLSGPDAMHSGADTSHRAQITIDSAGDAALPDGSHVIPGMTVTAEIKVGRRRLIAYFLSPITKGFSESLREP